MYLFQEQDQCNVPIQQQRAGPMAKAKHDQALLRGSRQQVNSIAVGMLLFLSRRSSKPGQISQSALALQDKMITGTRLIT